MQLFLFVFSFLFHLYTIPFIEVEPVKKTIPSIIFDSDIGPDYDDVGALAILHALADKKECRILATIASNRYDRIASVLDVLNTYFLRPDLPIGVVRGKAIEIGVGQNWDSVLVAKYPHDLKTNDQAEDALKLYRKILASQPDHSVTIVTVGFLTNMSNLMMSGPDEFSPLTGKELVRKKVNKLVSMAAAFGEGMDGFQEFNVKIDPVASKNVFDNWPVKIVFSGFEIGSKIFTGLPITKSAVANSPVKDVFEICIPMNPDDRNGRMSWDETAVLAAVRGIDPYFSCVTGTIIGKPDGSNSWDKNGKRDCYLVQKMPIPEMQKLLDDLIMHRPVTSTTSGTR
jgi:inosine-uridine nucleoside N-ribohydrolase